MPRASQGDKAGVVSQVKESVSSDKAAEVVKAAVVDEPAEGNHELEKLD